MNVVKAIKNNPSCVASITVRVRGRNTIDENKTNIINMKQKTQTNPC